MAEHTQAEKRATRERWLIAFVWFILGVVLGAWVASGFPTGILL